MEDEEEVGLSRLTWTSPLPDPSPQRPAPPPWAHNSEPSSSEDEEEDEKHDEEYEYEEGSAEHGSEDEPDFRTHSSSPLAPLPPSHFSHFSLNQPTFNAPLSPDAPQAAPAQQWVSNDPPPSQIDTQPSPEEVQQWLYLLKAHAQQQPEDSPLDDFLTDAVAAAPVDSRSTDDVLNEFEAVWRGVQTKVAILDGERPDVVEELRKLVELVGRCLERWPAEDEAGEQVLEMLRGWDSQLKFWVRPSLAQRSHAQGLISNRLFFQHVTESAYFTPHKEIRKIDDLMYGYFRDLSDSTTSVQHPDDGRIPVDSVHFALLPEICFHRCMRRRKMRSVDKCVSLLPSLSASRRILTLLDTRCRSRDVGEDILESDAKQGRLHPDWDTPLLQADWNSFSCFFDFDVRAALSENDEPDGQDSTSPSLPEATVSGSPSPLQSTFNDRPSSHQQPEPSQTLPSPPAFTPSSPSSPHQAVEQAEEHPALPFDPPFDAGAFDNASFAFEDYDFGTFDFSGLDLSTESGSSDLPAAADPFAFEAGPAGEPAFPPFSYSNHHPL